MPRRPASSATVQPYREALREWRRAYWTEVMAAAGGNVARAAELAGVCRTDVYATLRRYGVPFESRREGYGNAAWRALGR